MELTPGTSAFGFGPYWRSTNLWRLARSSAVSAAVAVDAESNGATVPPRALTMLSRIERRKNRFTTNSSLVTGLTAMKPPPAARTESTARFCALRSASDCPCDAVALRPEKMLARLTTVACLGCASGTLMISMRINDDAALESGVWATHPGSSLGDRIGAEPET